MGPDSRGVIVHLVIVFTCVGQSKCASNGVAVYAVVTIWLDGVFALSVGKGMLACEWSCSDVSVSLPVGGVQLPSGPLLNCLF